MELPEALKGRKPHPDTLEERLTVVTAWFGMNNPFFSALAFSMGVRIVDIPSIGATDYKTIYLDRNGCNHLDNEELKFLLAHETLHPALLHNTRRGSRDSKKWNIACDAIINPSLIEDKIGTMLPFGVNDQKLYDEAEGIAENAYDLLPDSLCGDGKKYVMMDEIIGGESGGEEGEEGADGLVRDIDGKILGSTDGLTREEMEAICKQRLASAHATAKLCGGVSAGMERLIGHALEAKVNWREALQEYVVKVKDDSRSWRRLSRRAQSQGLIAPSPTGDAIGELVVAVDCSGSIGVTELAQFAGEVKTIWEDHHPKKLHILYFDSEVCHYDTFGREDEPKLAFHGGGGTEFHPIWSFIEEKNIEPVACVVLTDLCCAEEDFGDPPSYPVLWVSTMRQMDTAPFGQVIVMDLDGEVG